VRLLRRRRRLRSCTIRGLRRDSGRHQARQGERYALPGHLLKLRKKHSYTPKNLRLVDGTEQAFSVEVVTKIPDFRFKLVAAVRNIRL
jgi:hypothetical protein